MNLMFWEIKKKHLRTEPKQLRKTVIVVILGCYFKKRKHVN